MKKAFAILGKIFLVLTLFCVTFTTVFVIYIFASPEFHVNSDLAARAVAKFAPESIRIGFKSFTLEINRPKGLFWSKTIVLQAQNLCVKVDNTAVDACLDAVRLAATAGFDGPVMANQSKWIPHIQRIEPLFIKGAAIHIDLTAFPKSENDKPSSFNFFDFMRKEILPKWDVEGSRVNVTDFKIRIDEKTAYSAEFDLQPGDGDQDVDILLNEFRDENGPLRAEALVSVTRPQDWGADSVNKLGSGGEEKVFRHLWKIEADGVVKLDAKRSIALKADAKIRDLQRYNFRAQTVFSGIDAIREVRVNGDVKDDAFKGLVSVKAGSKKTELQALDFFNCSVDADLEKRNGGIHCGPQSVRLQIRERALMHRPDLFIFNPEVDFKISNLDFGGEKKSADYTLNILMDHLGMLRLGTKLSGRVEIAKETKYSVKGKADAVIPQFKQIIGLLKVTPYAIPAPFNTFDGAVGLNATVDFSESGGAVNYDAATRLDSDFQSMHLDFLGSTKLEKVGSSLQPNTDLNVSIQQLMLSAPRFEVRAPPAFKPDSRFGVINQKVVREKLTEIREVSGSHFKVHVKTASAQAIRIATNVTKTPIPISLDIVFDDHSTEKSKVTGFAEISETTVELFKRNATVQSIRVDLLGSGDNRLNGVVGVNYGDYAITILLLGELADPQVRFASDPPLDDDQIVSVLLFGRPPYELSDDEKNSAANTKAAMADAVLGLGSLYLLASTPIQSVGYDPNTGRVVARVGLGGGASIELGAGDQVAGSGVGFRKRISKNFTFRTEIETAATSSGKVVQALIEWVRRF